MNMLLSTEKKRILPWEVMLSFHTELVVEL